MEGCSTLLGIKEVQIKAMVSSTSHLLEWPLSGSWETPSAGGEGRPCAPLVGMWVGTATSEESKRDPQRIRDRGAM